MSILFGALLVGGEGIARFNSSIMYMDKKMPILGLVLGRCQVLMLEVHYVPREAWQALANL